MQPELETDVLVVGSGPMGGALALALATYGIRVQVVTRQRWLANTPRAHVTNQRTMEVLRDLGVEQEVLAKSIPWEQMGDMLFTTSLAGEEIARLRAWGTGEERNGEYRRGSPCPLVDISQPYMEPILVKNALERGAHIRFDTDYLGMRQDADGVTVELQDRQTQRPYTARCRYLVGADGARSKVAKDIELPIVGEMDTGASAYVTFKADLSHLVEHRPSVLYRILTTAATGSQIGMGLLRAIRAWDYWIAGWGFDHRAGLPDLSEEAVRHQVRAFIGIPDIDIEIESVSTWMANRAYATHYTKGRVLCGGDAVHRHPPASGLGSNTGIQDAFNLGWKLAYVLQGRAAASLLDTYSDERAPVGRQVVERASQSRADYGPLNRALHAEGGPEDFHGNVLAKVFDPSAEGAALRDEMARALDLKNSEFNAQGVELNQRYASTAVLAEAGAEPEAWQRDPQLHLQPTTRPGARIPHAWLADRAGRKLSTLDLVGHGRFTLVTGLAGGAWAQAVERLGLPYLTCVTIGTAETRDVYFSWHRLREMDEAGAILVRPDGFIAWRHALAERDADEATEQLRAVLLSVLGEPSAASTSMAAVQQMEEA